jgi:formylglycine-generating enzyme required for sulfatase activity
MILVPGGTFMMGSPDDEPERSNAEGPQHAVNVPTFFMGRYPVTQAQWHFVAEFPQVNRELNPDPIPPVRHSTPVPPSLPVLKIPVNQPGNSL